MQVYSPVYRSVKEFEERLDKHISGGVKAPNKVEDWQKPAYEARLDEKTDGTLIEITCPPDKNLEQKISNLQNTVGNHLEEGVRYPSSEDWWYPIYEFLLDERLLGKKDIDKKSLEVLSEKKEEDEEDADNDLDEEEADEEEERDSSKDSENDTDASDSIDSSADED